MKRNRFSRLAVALVILAFGTSLCWSADKDGMAGTTGLEPAASAVTGQRSNQLNYDPLAD